MTVWYREILSEIKSLRLTTVFLNIILRLSLSNNNKKTQQFAEFF